MDDARNHARDVDDVRDHIRDVCDATAVTESHACRENEAINVLVTTGKRELQFFPIFVYFATEAMTCWVTLQI